jgi:hypothetical protein
MYHVTKEVVDQVNLTCTRVNCISTNCRVKVKQHYTLIWYCTSLKTQRHTRKLVIRVTLQSKKPLYKLTLLT